MLRAMSLAWKATLTAAVVLWIAGGAAGSTVGLARTCGAARIAGSAFQVEITNGNLDCGTARLVLTHARFREKSGVPGWSCWQGTRAYGFTSVVDGCDRWPDQIQAVPVEALPRIGKACRLFAGKGDSGVHSIAFRVHRISCDTARQVVVHCHTNGKPCGVGGATWLCRQPKQKPALGYGERCTSGSRFTSIVWLD